jgi:hypothetical protein
MKTILTLLALSFSVAVFSQTVLVEGKATDTISLAREDFPFRVILNDTVSRFQKSNNNLFLEAFKGKEPDLTKALKINENESIEVDKLYKNINYVVVPDKNGRFQIRAKLTDSLFFSSFRFITQKHAVSDLIKMKEINVKLEPEVCEKLVRCEENNPKLYVFIGEKIDVKRLGDYYCDNVTLLDSRFHAKYKIVKNMYGDLKQDTVSFTVFDHSGTPKFSNYKYVMLFVSEHCGKLYHEKYQYFDVYPTLDGRWARPGDPYQLDERQPKIVNAIPLKFKDELTFDITDKHPAYIKQYYSEAYFNIKNNKAFPLKGAYVETLFSIKKEGVLKARGFNFN